MKIHRAWHGVRMRRIDAAADPDEPLRPVTLPAAWDDAAASALVALAPGSGPITLVAAAQAWIDPIATRAKVAGLDLPLADRLHQLLLLRRGAPTEAVWQGHANDTPGFVLNLPAFLDSFMQFDAAGFAEAAETAVLALGFAAPATRDIELGMTDLAGLLAHLGIDYDSDHARDIARALATILRGRADAASGSLARLASPLHPIALDWPAPPTGTALPGLDEAARTAREAAAAVQGLRHRCTTTILAPGPADAFLGVETG